MTKPAYHTCDHQRCRSAYASGQSDQCLCYSLPVWCIYLHVQMLYPKCEESGLNMGVIPISLPVLSMESFNYHTCKISCRPSLSRAVSAGSAGNNNSTIYHYCWVESYNPQSTSTLPSTSSVNSTGTCTVQLEGFFNFPPIPVGNKTEWKD